jgi:hypothetical protein
VLGQVRRGGVSESADVDDAPDSGLPGGGAESRRGLAVAPREPLAGVERVNEVVRRVDSGERRGERRPIEDVSDDDPRRRGRSPGKGVGPSDETRERDAPAFELREQTPADVPRGARQEDASSGSGRAQS